ncbi:MAG: O-sialoglycoprotein endopeptidase [Clostridia bacterium]|nr:O-sialoglycoprotein endopeptidase [Clostridia bacterium]
MTAAVIGLDTSCYTTSCAAVTVEGGIIASCRKLLPVAHGQRGLRQSEAVFHHVRQLPALMEELGRHLRGVKVAAVCASRTPRDDPESYMPVFQVGDAQARALAAILGVPCFSSTHQRGHIAAARVDSGIGDGDLIAVHLSGGTTEVLSLRGEELTLLGGTADLHAGQLVDRAGVAMGLPFPAGPELEKLALRGQSAARLPVSVERDSLRVHLSGAETQVQRWLKEGTLPPEDAAREIYDFLARTVCRLVLGARERTGIGQVLIAGGVASSALFRELLTARIRKQSPEMLVCFGKPEYSGDNAVGAALIGAARLRAAGAEA